MGVAGLFLSCFYYAVVWKPETTDGQAESLIITPGSNRPVLSQRKKEKHRKRVRWIARFGLLLVPLLVFVGYRIYQYQVNLPPTDFKILVANFASSDSEDHRVTQEIFRNLEREMEPYGDEVKVERLNKSLGSIKAAKNAGKSQKAAIVIWGDYQVMEGIVPISVNFEILKDTTNFFELGETVQGKTQPAQLSELTSFELQTNLSQEMTFLSLFTLGMYRYLDENLQQAVKYFDRALAILPETYEPVNSLGKELVYYYLGNSSLFLELYNKALKFYNQAIAINPNLYQAWNNYGCALSELGKHQEAIISYDKVIVINPDNYYAWNNRGLALVNLGKPEQAIASFDKAIAINPDYDNAWNNRGIALANLGKHEQAIIYFDKATKINPNHDSAWSNRGNALGKLGKQEEAIASYNKAITINSELYQAWYNKARIYALQNDIDSALKNLEQAFNLNPELREYIKTDTAFDAIRDEQRFKDLMEEH